MSDEIRITRRVALPDKYEFYEIEWKTDSAGLDEMKVYASILEDMVSWIRHNYGKPTPETPTKISPAAKKGLSVVMLEKGDENFTLQGMTIVKIGNRSSGERDDGSTWERQGMTVEDVTGTLSVVAWGDQTDLFKGLMVSDTVDILNIRELKLYMGKKQAHLGSDSEVHKQ